MAKTRPRHLLVDAAAAFFLTSLLVYAWFHAHLLAGLLRL